MPRTVDDLQRELLAVCRGGSFAETWRKINAITEWPNLRSELGRVAQVNALRRQIAEINPNACMYWGWAGHGDSMGPPRHIGQCRRLTAADIVAATGRAA